MHSNMSHIHGCLLQSVICRDVIASLSPANSLLPTASTQVSLCWQDPATGRHQEQQLSATPAPYAPGTTTPAALLLPADLALPLAQLVVGHDGAGYSGAWRLVEVVLVAPRDGELQGGPTG
jgi:hypothetical protein